MSDLNKQRLLLRYVFRSCGGPTELEELTGIPRQNFTNWQVRGKVPILKAIQISRVLDINKWGLNYEDFKKLEEESECPSWEEVVKSYFLSKVVTVKLLKGDGECQKKKVRKKKRKKRSKVQ